jgi:hypothetical protein
MAARLRALIPDPRERRFDMRSLWRLGIWGMSASLALVLAVAAGYSDTGSRRAVATRGDLGSAPKGNTPAIPPANRLPEIDAETRRLSDAMRSLTDEREQLLTRIGTLERNLEDVTGAIKRQATPTGVAPAAAAPAPLSANAAKGAAAAPADPQPADSAKPPAREAEPQPAAAAPERVANAPTAAPPEEPPATGFGVDIGGAANFEGLRVLWSSTKAGNAAVLDSMRPQVIVRENTKTKGTELRLIVGPIANVEEAARMCATLSAGRRYCQPVAFEGQALPDADAVPPAEHKAEKTSQHKPPAAKPKPADTTPRVLRFFR